jgi:hypothetical protein
MCQQHAPCQHETKWQTYAQELGNAENCVGAAHSNKKCTSSRQLGGEVTCMTTIGK